MNLKSHDIYCSISYSSMLEQEMAECTRSYMRTSLRTVNLSKPATLQELMM